VRAVVAALFGAADLEMAPSLIGPPVLAASPAGPVDFAVQRQAADPGVPRSVGGDQHDRQPAQGEAAWWTPGGHCGAMQRKCLQPVAECVARPLPRCSGWAMWPRIARPGTRRATRPSACTRW
jgi:hypothetical protein